MGTPGPSPDVTPEDALDIFAQSDQPCTPLTATEVAEELECARRTAHRKLEELAERGEIHSKKTGARSRIWWRSPAESGAAERDADERSADEPAAGGRSNLEQFGTFVRAVEDYAIFMLNPDGNVVSWNEGAERIKGYAEEEIVGEHFSVFYPDAAVEEGIPERNLESAAAEGRVEDEGWRVREDGSRFWADVVITAIRDDDGELQGFTKVTRDMTEQREYEQQLRRERNLTEQILETVPVSISVLAPDGEFVQANSRALDRLNLDASDLGEHSVDTWDLYDDEGEPIPADDRPWARVAETGAAVYDYECQVDFPEIDRRWLSINAVPLEDDESDEDRIVLSMDDVTERKEHERQLRRERNQTEELVRTAPVAITVEDGDGDTLLANRRAREIFGLSGQERDGIQEPAAATDWDVYDADGDPIDPAESPPARVRETGEPVWDEELVIENPDGERTWFSINAAPITGSDGTLERVVTTGEDITELKEHERQLERRKSELETELSEIFGRISDAFYALDEEWRFTHANERSEHLLQHPREEILGENFWDVFPDAADTVVWDRFHQAMETQQPVSFEMEYDSLDIWVELNAYPSETGLSVYFQDVTERREREQALERYRTIVETVDDGIYTVSPDGTFTMVNEAYAEMTGYSREELLGSDVSLVVDDEIVESTQTLEADLAAGEREQVMIEAEIQTADGDRVPSEATFALLPGDEAEYERVGVVRDITERKEQQRALAESERRYRTLVENFPEGAVGLFDEELRYTAVGGQMLDEVGVAEEDRVGSSVHEIYPDELVEEVEPYFHAALDGEMHSFEASFHGRHLLAHTLPIRDADDEVYAGMLVVQDITDRKEMERDLRESEAKFRMLAENLEEIVWMATPDAGEFIYLNPAFEEVWGIDRETLYEEPLSFLDQVHEEDRERVREAFGELPEDDFDEEYRIVRPDGEIRWAHSRGTRVTDGEMTRIVGIGQDITERVERDRELERALDLLEKTERIADVGGWEIDPETADVFWSDHIFELLEVPADEEPTLDEALAMYHEEDQPVVEDVVETALDSADSFDVEARIRTDGEEIRWLRLQGVPETVDGDVVSFRGAAQDVTERKRREQRLEELVDRLEESNERLEQFAYAASHDLQEPLRMVSSYLQLIERRYSEALDEDGEEFLEFAVDGADRMREMIDGLLQYSRVETQGDPLEPVELDAVFEAVRDDLGMQIAESDAEVTAESLPRVEGDRSQLRQVFQNLLSNAIEYSGDEPPRVHVTAEQDHDEWVISVRDEGIGIDANDADRIFQVFERGHNAEDRGGTGIGLALCERIVERHGGEMWVESEPGEGATFSFTLPPAGDDDA